MTNSTINIGLLWHSPNSGNLGVGALTVANMAIVRQVAEGMGLTPRFTIMGMRDRMERYVGEGEAAQLTIDRKVLTSPNGFWASMRAQDCILDIGAGDSFTDIYHWKRFVLLWGTKALTILGGRPLLLSPQTIGPFSRQPYTALAAWAMDRAESVIARDRASLDAIERMAPRARRVLAADVAFTLPYTDQSALRGGVRPRVGVNVSGLLWTEAVAGTNRYGLDADYAALTRRLIESLHARGAEVHLFAHCRHFEPYDDDAGVIDGLCAEYPWAIRVPDFAGPSEAKSYISGLDLVISARMHACIAAISSGTAVVPIAYSRKFIGVFGLVDYPWMVDVAGKTTDQAHDFILDCYERRAELAAAARQSVPTTERLLDNYRDELRALFTRLRPAA